MRTYVIENMSGAKIGVVVEGLRGELAKPFSAMTKREHGFWLRQPSDRADRRHAASYGRRRATFGHCAWRRPVKLETEA